MLKFLIFAAQRIVNILKVVMMLLMMLTLKGRRKKRGLLELKKGNSVMWLGYGIVSDFCMHVIQVLNNDKKNLKSSDICLLFTIT